MVLDASARAPSASSLIAGASYKRTYEERAEASNEDPPTTRLKIDAVESSTAPAHTNGDTHDGEIEPPRAPARILGARRTPPHFIRTVTAGDEDDDESDDGRSCSTDSSDSGAQADEFLYEPQHRREMLDLSINKLQTMNTRAPSLRKSVLIFNTMRYLQDEISSSEHSPMSSGDEELELDLPGGELGLEPPPTQITIEPSCTGCPPIVTYSSPDAHVSRIDKEPLTSAWTPSIDERRGRPSMAGEILLSYEMLNSRSAAAGSASVSDDVHVVVDDGDEHASVPPGHISAARCICNDDDDEDGMEDEAQVIAALGLTDVVQAIMAD